MTREYADIARKAGYEMGAYALSGGVPVTLGEGRRLDDYTARGYEGTFLSVPYLHSSQQLDALWHAEDSAGFDDETVTFTVNWLWMEPTELTVKIDSTGVVGWVQGEGKLV